MILLIDNYDSFSYNLYQQIGSIRGDIKVIRNDTLTISEIEELDIDYIVLSPGPGRPEEAGICIEVIQHFAGKILILGVCLGHQAICKAFGAEVSYAKQRMHGKTSTTYLEESRIFKGLGESIQTARYHSLAAVSETMPECLRIIAETTDGEIMAVEHTDYPIYGLQFHPESILTPDGIAIIRNFLI